MINNEVPQETVRRLRDHDSHAMTAHYARLSDTTIRQQWERARKLNIAGAQLAIKSSPLADAVWMKNNLARAKTALPNGYCALRLQQKSEFANACLTCPVFVTTAEFLPQHRHQLEQTRALIAKADHNGHQRLAEMNRAVEKNLLAIINGAATASSCWAAEAPAPVHENGSAARAHQPTPHREPTAPRCPRPRPRPTPRSPPVSTAKARGVP
ncbi:hypothetical protein [Streptomyces sp. NPDC059168]|uniref:hypothetical protein n=1 Tax=Streptomyces sp. NPDC059168 TaxID=3346753 RepID=UPI0036B59BFE